MRVAEVMPPAPPATKWAHALRSLGEERSFEVEEEDDGLVDGSTWPSSRDWEDGAAKADTAGVGVMVAICAVRWSR